MRLRSLIALGVAAFLLFAIVTLPASLLLSFFKDSGLTAAGVEGTVWKGRAQLVQIEGANLGTLEWDLHALALLTLRLQADVRVARTDGFAQGRVAMRSSRSIAIRNLTASLPVSTLGGLASGWAGTVNLKFAQMVLTEGWPSAADGTAEILNLNSPSGRSPLSGSYKVTFPAPNTPSEGEVLTGALADLGGPLQISGTLELRPERVYVLQGLVAPRPDAPRNLAQQLQFLGEPDAQGRYPFSLEGSM